MVASPVLRITNGSEYVDIVQSAPYDINKSGIALTKWSPSLPSVNNDGIWTQPIFFGGKSLIYKSLGNIVDTFELIVYGTSQNNVIEKIKKLQDILEKAVYFWTESHTYSPVWLEAKSPYEDSTRYSVIIDYRINEYPNPYLPPFSSKERAAARNITLVIEHKGWTANAPGDSDCVNTYGNLPYPYYLEFYEDTSRISCEAGSAIDNLPSGNFTAEAWVYPEGYGGMGYGAILWKYATGLGWYLRLFNNSYRLEARIEYSTTDAYTRTSTSLKQNQWNHVAITYDKSTTRLIYVWINGQEAAYSQQIAAAGTYSSDATENLYIGNDNSNTRNWYGKIGWVRINRNIIYSSSFTPEERCSIPKIASSCKFLLLHDGYSHTTTSNVAYSGSNGTITDCSYRNDCDGYGRTDAFCSLSFADDPGVFVRNAYINRHFDYVFYYDQSSGSYTNNLISTSLPYDLLPTPVSVGDVLYVGTRDLRTFDNVVFDLVTPGSGFTGSWQYWDSSTSSWQNFITSYFIDYTSGLTKSGINAVVAYYHFLEITDKTTINGISAYYWRFLVTSASSPTTPVQGNRQVYSCMWPYFRIDNTKSKSINALGSVEIHPENETWGRFIVGKRKENRGKRFQGYINFGGYNDPDIVITLMHPDTTIVEDHYSPVDQACCVTLVAGTRYYVSIRISDNVASNYIGKFRIFVRARGPYGGSSTATMFGRFIADINVSDSIAATYSSPYTANWESQEFAYPENMSLSPFLIDLGEIFIGSTQMLNNESLHGTTFFLQITSENTGALLYLHNLILIPSDEWYADVISLSDFSKHRGGVSPGQLVTIDSVYNAKSSIRSLAYDKSTQKVIYSFPVGASSELRINNDSIERFYILPIQSLSENIWLVGERTALFRVSMHKTDTYQSFIGRS